MPTNPKAFSYDDDLMMTARDRRVRSSAGHRIITNMIQQAREASEMFERLGDAVNQARCSIDLVLLLYSDEQFDAAEEASFRVMKEKSEQVTYVGVTAFLAGYVTLRVRQRRPFRRPSKLHLLITWTVGCFGHGGSRTTGSTLA